jgi:hypothetical protein
VEQRTLAGLELARLIPVFTGPAFNTSTLLPKDIGSLAEMLIEGPMPVFVGLPLSPPFLAPKRVRTLAHGLFKTEFSLGTAAYGVFEGFHTPSPALVHLSDQACEFSVGDQLPMSSRLQRLGLVFSILNAPRGLVQRHGVGVNDPPAAVQYVYQPFCHYTDPHDD